MSDEHLAQLQENILGELASIRTMKKGTVTHQHTVVKKSPGSSRKGSYPVLTWKEDGKTKSMRLRSEEDVAWAQEAIANYRRFQRLCQKYEKLVEQQAFGQRALRQPASEEAEKKGLKSRPSKRRK